jgi:hypothetical protein
MKRSQSRRRSQLRNRLLIIMIRLKRKTLTKKKSPRKKLRRRSPKRFLNMKISLKRLRTKSKKKSLLNMMNQRRNLRRMSIRRKSIRKNLRIPNLMFLSTLLTKKKRRLPLRLPTTIKRITTKKTISSRKM